MTPAPTMSEVLTTILSAVSTFLTSVLSWFAQVAELATSNAIIFIFLVAMPLVTFVISVVLWLVRSRSSRGRG